MLCTRRSLVSPVYIYIYIHTYVHTHTHIHLQIHTAKLNATPWRIAPGTRCKNYFPPPKKDHERGWFSSTYTVTINLYQNISDLCVCMCVCVSVCFSLSLSLSLCEHPRTLSVTNSLSLSLSLSLCVCVNTRAHAYDQPQAFLARYFNAKVLCVFYFKRIFF